MFSSPLASASETSSSAGLHTDDASAARRMAYRRLAAAILRVDIDSLTADLQAQRLVIGRTAAGQPRTYRVIRHRPWRARLMLALAPDGGC